MKKILWLFALASAVLPLDAQESPQAIIAKVQGTLASLASFQAEFEQTSYSTSVSTPFKEKGRLFFKKPDLMRWEYKGPEEKIYVYKEGILLSYFPEDNQLLRQKIPEEQYEIEILALLAGRGNLTEKYLIESSPFPGESPQVAQLKLTPKAEGEYAYILLEIDRKSAFFRRAIFFDWAGNKTEFIFAKIKTNVRYPKDLFEIKVPPDCEIIDDEPLRKK